MPSDRTDPETPSTGERDSSAPGRSTPHDHRRAAPRDFVAPALATAALIVGVGLVFFTLHEPIFRQLERLPAPQEAAPIALPAMPPSTAVGRPSDSTTDRSESGVDATRRASPQRRPPAPRSATLAEVSDAMSAFGPATRELLLTGREELAELASRPVRDDTARQIAARRRAQWARVWRARARQLVEPLPSIDGCRRHPLLTESCVEMRAIATDLARAATAAESSVEEAVDQLDGVEARLTALLEPAPSTEEQPDDEPLGDEPAAPDAEF